MSLKTQQPRELCERILLSLTTKGDRVCDLFAGTGTMAVECKYKRREYFGIDINELYVKEAEDRVLNQWKLIAAKQLQR